MLARSALFFSKNSLVLSAAKTRVRLAAPRRPWRPYTLAAAPQISARVTGYWLAATSGLVFGIVVVGGLTRLTELGLSITEWRPVTGLLPPLSAADWEAEFAKYRRLPEFVQLNSHISMDEFKFIYRMEWGHRLLGRAIGVFFVVPAVFFWRTRRLLRSVSRKVAVLTGLLGLQGAIGWWMVQLGLDERQLQQRRLKPTVLQYRLTTHLGAAFLMYLGTLWAALEVLHENRWLDMARRDPRKVAALLARLSSPQLNGVRSLSRALLALAFCTAMSGGMVAGLDAGLIYNTFPHMGDEYPYVPSGSELMSPVYARRADLGDLWWRNLLENPTTVQLVHRVLATTTFVSIVAAHVALSRNKLLPRAAARTFHGIVGLATLQVCLGISTLVYLVPVPLAAAHQAGALALLTGCLAFAANVRRPRAQAVARFACK